MNPFANDIALLTAFQQGDTLAGKFLFDSYFQPLCLFAERITGDLLQSEDIVAESFEKVIVRRNDFPSVLKLKSFLYQIVYNACMNHISSQKRHLAAHEQIRYLAKNDLEEGDGLQNEILRAELLHQIYREMDSLPDKCGRIFKMIFVEELSTHEIAGRLDINVQTVRTQKARAIGLIKNALLRKNPRAAALLSTYFAWFMLISEI